MVNDKTQELSRRDTKCTLEWVHRQLTFSLSFEDLTKILNVVQPPFGYSQEVINVTL